VCEKGKAEGWNGAEGGKGAEYRT